MKRSIYVSVRARLTSLALFLTILGGKAFSQQSLESNFRMTGAGLLEVFEPQRQEIQKISAVIYDGRKEIAYGIVISPDGYILSKASEVEGVGDLSVRVDRESFSDAKVVLVDPRWDVALIKVNAKSLVPADFAEGSDLPQGTWVVVNGATSRTKRRVLAGIISAASRNIPAAGGVVMGVMLGKAEGEIVIGSVTEGSGAEEAGLKEGDVILGVDGKRMTENSELTGHLEDKKAGETLALLIKRGEETLEIEVRLAARGEVFAEMTRNDQMSGDFSERRSGFARVIQHDILANSETMGGPVIGLNGKVVGMNIARANRAETFAIPVEELREIARDMVAEVSK